MRQRNVRHPLTAVPRNPPSAAELPIEEFLRGRNPQLEGYARYMGDFLELHPRSALDEAIRTGEIAWLVPAGWPREIPADVPPPFPKEAVDVTLVSVRAIVDDEVRARAILAANVIDDGPRARELILSVVGLEGGWPGAIAQGLMRRTDDDEALASLLEANRAYFESEGRRILRNLTKNSPELLWEMRMRAFPHLMRPRHSEGPSLLDVLAEFEAQSEVAKPEVGNHE